MAIEKLNRAAREAQPKVISMAAAIEVGGTVPRLIPQLMLSSLMLTPVAATTIVTIAPPAAGVAARIEATASTPAATLEKQQQRAPYPQYRVVVLDDDVNTFQHVVECLVRYIPAMTPDRAWELAHRIDGHGSAVVWCGPQEQAELYHQQLGAEGLTMAPLERA
jgi:ATP-dependent Clp protease adaptor protein ClpS